MADIDSGVAYRIISELITGKTPVTVFLVNGVKLEGFLTEQDDVSVSLTGTGQTKGAVNLVFKNAISTIKHPDVRG